MTAHRELKRTFQVDHIKTMILLVDLSFVCLLSWRKGFVLVTYFFLPLCIKTCASTTCPENAYAEVIWHSLRFLWANTVSSLAVGHLGNWVQLLNNSCACGSWMERGPCGRVLAEQGGFELVVETRYRGALEVVCWTLAVFFFPFTLRCNKRNCSPEGFCLLLTLSNTLG